MAPNESAASGEKPSDSQGVTACGHVVPHYPNAAPMAEPALRPTSATLKPTASPYLHAFRRRWLLAAIVAFTCGTLAAAAAWFCQEPTYNVLALLRIAASQEPLAFNTLDNRLQGNPDAYRASQPELVKSPFVLAAALRKPEVARLATLRGRNDPAGWLAKALQVKIPKDTDIMRVCLKSADPAEAVALVKAVVDAYMNEVVDMEQKQRQRRLSELDRAATDKEGDVRRKRTDLKQLTEQLGSGDTQTLSVKQQIQLQQFGELRKQVIQVQAEIWRAEGQLKAQQALLDAAAQGAKIDPPQEELAAVLAADPVYKELFRQKAELAVKRAMTESVVQAPASQQLAPAAPAGLAKVLDAHLDSRRKQLQEEAYQSGRTKAQAEVKRLQAQIAVLNQQEQLLNKDVAQLRKETEQIGSWSTDVEMMRNEIKQLEEVLNGIAREREQLKVELRSAPRVTLIQPAQAPDAPDQTIRIALAGFSGLAGLLIPLAFIVWSDVRSQRINSSTEVPRESGLSVIGAVPLIPPRVIRHLASPGKRYRYWRAMLTESIDSIAARLLHIWDRDGVRVILISSAVGGEGKTTLAVQLAMSLARSGRRTVLVDFDLRRPMIDRVFKIQPWPGVSEMLRGESEFPQIPQPTKVNNLFVVSAGRWDRNVLARVSNGEAGSLFRELRAAYEYVVVDGCPILPVADAKFLCQHMDAVILSILRDVSRAPRVRAACEILSALGVRTLGAVVADSADDAYYKDPRYEPQPTK